MQTERPKKIAILQSNYIPWKGYFDLINSVDQFVIYDEVQYTKNDWRNRNIIKTKQGTEWITIPVRHEFLGQRIDEIKVFQNNWNKKHWNTIQSIYGRAPFFREVKSLFEDLYGGADSPYLSEINLRFIKAIARYLNITTEIIDSRDLNLAGDKNERLVDACRKLKAGRYLSGPAARDYLDEGLFSSHQIEVEWMDYSGYPEYPQVSEPFTHGVSIVDLIFNTGPQASHYMKSFKA